MSKPGLNCNDFEEISISKSQSRMSELTRVIKENNVLLQCLNQIHCLEEISESFSQYDARMYFSD